MKKKLIKYLVCMLTPVLIFLGMTCINGFLPFGLEHLNAYDSFTQYPCMLLEYSRLLKNGNVFYSFGAGLGFNFFSSILYYGISPLNLTCLLATPLNYHMYSAIMILLRFALLSGTMCFYLSSKNYSTKIVVLFSVLFSLMGFTATYYYNYIWIDSVIMLPIVIYALDKLIDKNNPTLYFFALTFTICINYYIGYMICIFCLLYFIYRIVNIKNKKTCIKNFILYSLLAGLSSAVVLLPSFYALMAGKASLYSNVKYTGLLPHYNNLLYMFFPGSYQSGDQGYGPPQIYVGLITVVLCITYFCNSKYTKKEKITTALIMLFFILSFTFKIFNYAWQMFQRPIWWQSRFSFTFSFFLIIIAAKSLNDIDGFKIKNIKKLIIGFIFIILTLVCAYFKLSNNANTQVYTYIFLLLGLIIFIEELLLINNKYFLPFLIFLSFIDVSINTYNSMKNNYRYKSYMQYQSVKEKMPKILSNLNKENDTFYRLEFMNYYTSLDGMYFGFNGLNYFNSVRNINTVNIFENLGFSVSDKANIKIKENDPIMLTLLGVKYLYGETDYFEDIGNNVHKNPNFLGIGYMVSNKIYDYKFESNYYNNIENLLNYMVNKDTGYYDRIDYTKINILNEYTLNDDKVCFEDKNNNKAKYEFKSNKDYLFVRPLISSNILVNDVDRSNDEYYIHIKKGDNVTINLNPYYKCEKTDKFTIRLLDIEKMQKDLSELEKNIIHGKTNVNKHIFEGKIDVTEDKTTLFLTIPYEEGMKIRVDGKSTNPKLFNESLILLDLDKGAHKITIDYVPKGLIEGSIITLLSISITIISLQKRKNKI